MNEKTKKALNLASGIAIAAGAVGFVLTGGAESGAITIISVAIAALGGVIALIGAIRK